MKKLYVFLIIVCLLGLSTQTHAQNSDKAKTALNMPYSGDNVLYHAFQKYLEALRVIIVGDSTLESSAKLDTLNILLHTSTKAGGDDSLTVTTETDTIYAPAGTAHWWTFDLINISTATIIEWSLDGAWAWQRELLVNQSFYTKERLDVAAFPYVVIRRRSASGTGIYDITTFGY